MFDRGESTPVNQETSCPPTVVHRNQNITVTPLEMSTVAEQTLEVYLLAGEGVLYPLMGRPGRAGGDRLPSMCGKK